VRVFLACSCTCFYHSLVIETGFGHLILECFGACVFGMVRSLRCTLMHVLLYKFFCHALVIETGCDAIVFAMLWCTFLSLPLIIETGFGANLSGMLLCMFLSWFGHRDRLWLMCFWHALVIETDFGACVSVMLLCMFLSWFGNWGFGAFALGMLWCMYFGMVCSMRCTLMHVLLYKFFCHALVIETGCDAFVFAMLWCMFLSLPLIIETGFGACLSGMLLCMFLSCFGHRDRLWYIFFLVHFCETTIWHAFLN
jgi:hypothetical protein